MLAGVGSYAYNLGVAHGVAVAGSGCPCGRGSHGQSAPAVGIRLRVLPVLPVRVHPVLVLRHPRAILAWTMGIGRGTDTAACRRRSTSGTAAPTRSRTPPSRTKRTADVKHILVVDDEPRITEITRDYLERAGFRVTTAANGADALAIARSRRPISSSSTSDCRRWTAST